MNGVVARINELRVGCGLSKAALAEKIGVSKNTVGNWSAKDSMPSVEVIERICQVANITIGQFFHGIDCGSNADFADKFLDEMRVLTNAERVAIEKVIDAFYELR